MQKTVRNIVNDTKGYSLVEMLIVCGIIIILATVPIALIRNARDRLGEAEALKSLRMMALAYENYYAQNGHLYPNYRLDGVLEDDIRFKSDQEIWEKLITEKLLPRAYSGHAISEPDLLAKGYRFTIFPARAGQLSGSGVRNSYAMALMPYADSPATRGLAMVRGTKFYTSFPTAVPRKMSSGDLTGLDIYTFTE